MHKVKYKITVTHPFSDGNGRVSRALLNWLFHLKGLYPLYVKLERKHQYLSALEIADASGNLEALAEFVIDEIIESDSILNKSNI